MKRLLVSTLGWVALVSGCGFAPSAPQVLLCSSDAECGEGQVCFPDGCGDPFKNVVVEVTVNNGTGHYAQDFPVPSPMNAASVNIEAFPPVVLTGEMVQRVSTPNGIEGQLYQAPVVVRAQGVSALIPGVARNYEVTISQPERGAYALYLGTGRYTVSVYPADMSIPPAIARQVVVNADTANALNFSFPALEELLIIGGRLIKNRQLGSPGGDEVAITQTTMDIQAFDAATGLPLSQRVPVSSGFSGSRGDFVMGVDPAANALGSLSLVATPREPSPTVMVPEKTFTLLKPYPANPILELGDFGDPLLGVKGDVVSSNGVPIEGALVKLEGTVMGGGHYRAATVMTDSNGQFSVNLLPNGPNQSYTATTIPPGNSPSGLWTLPVRATSNTANQPLLTPSRMNCPDKVLVVGTLLRPTREPATAVKVMAYQKGINQAPTTIAASTDPLGRFTLALDPGDYELQFLPGADLPRMSRVITVKREAPTDGGLTSKTLDLKEFVLSRGRIVRGVITAKQSQGAAALPAPNAVVRFFRVAKLNGKESALLLSETVANARGEYSVVMPTNEK